MQNGFPRENMDLFLKFFTILIYILYFYTIFHVYIRCFKEIKLYRDNYKVYRIMYRNDSDAINEINFFCDYYQYQSMIRSKAQKKIISIIRKKVGSYSQMIIIMQMLAQMNSLRKEIPSLIRQVIHI